MDSSQVDCCLDARVSFGLYFTILQRSFTSISANITKLVYELVTIIHEMKPYKSQSSGLDKLVFS